MLLPGAVSMPEPVNTNRPAPPRSRQPDPDLFPQLIATVVTVATKAAESGTAVAAGFQTLERVALGNRDFVTALTGEVKLLTAEIEGLKATMERLERKNEQGFWKDMVAAFRTMLTTPATLGLILLFVAAALGIKFVLPEGYNIVPTPIIVPAPTPTP